MASIISPFIRWILTLAGYYFAAATLHLVVLTTMKTQRNLIKRIWPTTMTKKRKCENLSLTSTKTTRNARAVLHCAEASSSRKNTKCTPPSFYSGDESNTEIKEVSGHPSAPSSPPEKNSVQPHPPYLIGEEEPKQIRHLVDRKSSTELSPLPPRRTISPQLAVAVTVLKAPQNCAGGHSTKPMSPKKPKRPRSIGALPGRPGTWCQVQHPDRLTGVVPRESDVITPPPPATCFSL